MSLDVTDRPAIQIAGSSTGWRAGARKLLLGRSLAECVESRRDNILQLRLLAALMVVFGHSYVLVGRPASLEEPLHLLLPRTYMHLVGVMMFFMISGFLITLSYLRRPELGRFLRARVLRLWPALIVCVGIWSFVLGPVLSDLSLHDYFAKGDSRGTAYRYFWHTIALSDTSPFLPGLFASLPIPYQVNASLWTIPYEAKMYLCVAVAGAARLLRLPWLASLVIAAVFIKIVLWPMYTGTVHMTVAFFGLQLAGFFGAGSIACLLRRYVPISTALFLLILATCLLVRGWVHDTPFMWLAVAYFVLWFAYVPRLPAIPGKLDLSYGTYLWAFPVQQTVIVLGKVSHPLVLFAIVTPIVLAIATLSWLCVERPALRLKSFRLRRASAPKGDDIPGQQNLHPAGSIQPTL